MNFTEKREDTCVLRLGELAHTVSMWLPAELGAELGLARESWHIDQLGSAWLRETIPKAWAGSVTILAQDLQNSFTYQQHLPL